MLILSLSCFSKIAVSQELFVYSEPASNMAAKSLGFRLANNIIHQETSNSTTLLLVPEVMIGISKKFMVHSAAFLENSSHKFRLTGGEVYLKYRFYSADEIHSHFRMAIFARASHTDFPALQKAIDLYGKGSGYEAGLVATKLMNKTAVSGAFSLAHSTNAAAVRPGNFKNSAALNYNAAIGSLVLPKEYINYNQLNVNLMLELLGQTSLLNGQSYLDLAASVQFIILSRMRIDLGYRIAVLKDLERANDYSYLVKLEYNIFNAYK